MMVLFFLLPAGWFVILLLVFLLGFGHFLIDDLIKWMVLLVPLMLIRISATPNFLPKGGVDKGEGG